MTSRYKFRNDSVDALEPKDCYVGQHVYWIMWVDPAEPYNKNDRTGWYAYKQGCVPEIWSSVVERVTSKKIWVRDYSKLNANLYSCEQNAITGEYERFCDMRLSSGSVVSRLFPRVTLGEASIVLRKLAELEFNLNNSNYSSITPATDPAVAAETTEKNNTHDD